MKIKTITCHDVYNTGSSLQSYALMNYLEELGHDVEIIDYKPEYLSGHYNLLTVTNDKYKKNIILSLIYIIGKLPSKLGTWKRKVKFDNFKANYLKVTSKKYTSNEDLKKDPPIADIYFVGSDQVWNTLHRNGKDPAFYLDFVPHDKIKASYAASFSTDKLFDNTETKIKKSLDKFNFISVRETTGLDILEKININNGIQVMDPVFLKEKRFWEELSLEQLSSEKYIFIYDFDNNKVIKDVALKIAKENNYKIYSVFNSNYADKHIKNVDPLEFITYIKNAEYVLSNSFHASAFSIILQKNFINVRRKEAINTRMEDLLELFGLQDRLVENINDFKKVQEIDYQKNEKILSDLVTKSKDYIDLVLNTNL